MLNQTIQIKFRQRLNKIASDDYDNIECWQIVESFNKAQLEWCRRNLHGNNMFQEGDEVSTRRIDDLQVLLTTLPITTADMGNHDVSTNFPDNETYLEYKRVSLDATSECCPEPRSMTCYLTEEANIDLVLRDPLKNPNFDWGETVCTMANNTLKIYKEDFNIVSPTLMYYRQPVRIEILGCVDPYTGNASAADIECEFKDDLVEIFIDEACAIIAGDISDVNNYGRELQAAERNN
tara:strand:+ start:3401 stop:4108 length:708 start_codon:yes stop_codon:yes gene_type:complete